MNKKFMVILVVIIFLISCGGDSTADLKNLTNDYTALNNKFKKRETGIKSYKEYQTFMTDKKKAFEEILEKYKDSARSEGIDILKAKIYIKTGSFDDGYKLADKVIAAEGKLVDEARMVKVQALFGKKDVDGAYKIFSTIEKNPERGEDYYSALMNFAFESSDSSVRKTFTKKLIDAADLPEEFKKYIYMFHANLASIAKEENDLEGAKKILQDAIGITTDPRGKKSLESELAQLEFLGKKAPSISAETWLNSQALSLDSLKGKVVIIDFWAPWCSPCRAVIPGLIEEYAKHKNDGLVVIGFTKLYGSYRDDVQNAGKVDRIKEIELIKGFAERFKIDYPIAISDEGKDFDSYMITGIPTMIFINREGNVDFIKIGSGNHKAIVERIEKLLGK